MMTPTQWVEYSRGLPSFIFRQEFLFQKGMPFGQRFAAVRLASGFLPEHS